MQNDVGLPPGESPSIIYGCFQTVT